MSSWKKHFKPVNTILPIQKKSTGHSHSTDKFSSWLPEVYQGPADRLQRYSQYEQMNMDHEVSAALDTIAEFCTQKDETTGTPFKFEFNYDPSDSELSVLQRSLKQWCEINEFNRRMFRIFRSTLMYGDQFMIRDPQSFKLYWVDPNFVEKVIVNESKGKKLETYFIKELDLNHQSLVASAMTNSNKGGFATRSNAFPQGRLANMGSAAQGATSSYYTASTGQSSPSAMSMPVDAEYVIHISLSEGMDSAWPFGISELEPVFKIFKQKSMLEDAMLIYRIHRAPERRMFFIDVGDMPPMQAQQHLEQVKYNMQQKRIPSKDGMGGNITDAAYNPLCMSLDTEIPLLDGRTLPLSTLISEYDAGKENWVYSCDPVTGKVVPGNITWAGVTKKDAKVIKVTLDNGESFTVTPEHKVPVLGKGYVEAKDLTVNDPLISFETRQKSLSQDKDRSYEQVFDHETNSWRFTHRMVGEFFKDIGKHQVLHFSEELYEADKNTVHHADYNRSNNDPRNLKWMNYADHRLYHSFTRSQMWENMSPEEAIRVKDKIRESLRQYWEDMSDEDYAAFCEQCSIRNKRVREDMKANDPERYAEWGRDVSESRIAKFEENGPAYQRLREISSSNLRANKAINQEFVPTHELLVRMVEIIKENDSDRLGTMAACNSDYKFKEILKRTNPKNPKAPGTFKDDELTDKKLRKIYSTFGYSGWRDLKDKTKVFNHRITQIEYLDDTMDVGTLTIDGNNRWHGHHTFAIKSGIFVKNSSLEDYYFAVGADGRGSKVEVLPGGDNLGEINDMLYFNNKMFRALGIPSSYLPTGPEDGGASSSDGKVGTAFIQEHRFTERCKRHQRQISPTFDREFKIFMKERGITIDNSMFKLEFTAPQNFSEYRQIELDSARVAVFSQVSEIPYVSKIYALKRYLGWNELDIKENEKYWRMENPIVKPASGDADNPTGGVGLGQVGMSGSDFETDDFGGEDMSGDGDMGDGGDIGGDDGGAGDIGMDDAAAFGK